MIEQTKTLLVHSEPAREFQHPPRALPVILVVGLNHATASIEVRERIASLSLDALASPNLYSLLSEKLFLSTCNRTEIYAVARDGVSAEAGLRDFLVRHGSEAEPIYADADGDAVAHLFAVASGIDSMMVGEFEILGQVRAAYLAAAQKKTIGPILHQLFKDALRVGKRARSETAIGIGATSVAYAAVALARQQLGELSGRRALVIGAGEMARRVAKNFAAGACRVVIANRTVARAREIARQINGDAITFDQLPAALVEADFVVSATAAPQFILDPTTIAAAMQQRARRALYFFDIAVPRDIDPRVAEIENAHLFNIDDLQSLVDANRAQRAAAISQVQAIIAGELEIFWQWYLSRRAAPVLSALRHRGEMIRQKELQRALRRLTHLQLNERDRNVIAALSAGIVNKLLATPTVRLKEQAQNGNGQIYFDLLRDLFELNELGAESIFNEHDNIKPTL